jgi:hypothetical protein
MQAFTSFVVVTLLLTFSAHDLSAQAITAKVVGTVTDASGAAVPGAGVTIQNVQTNQSRSTKANDVGNYEFSFLSIGSYTLTVEAPGFQKSEVTPFQLSVDQTARVNVQLTVGEVSERVSVEATSIGLQTEDVSVGTVIDSQKVVDLPLNGRSFVQLALLTPGVNPGTPGSITVRRNRGSVGQSVGMSANGARDTQNRFFYDGIESMDLDSYNFSFSPSIDAIREFRVETSTYSALVGGAPGGQVNLMTKSGGSSLHGGLWEFNRNDAFASLAPFQPYSPTAKPPRLNRNQFGGNIGGPVFIPKIYKQKDKTFFFFNWESGRQISGSFGGTAFVPPVAYRTGDFSGAPVTIFDPSTGQPFPSNIIPQSRIQSYASKFLSGFVPPPNTNQATIDFRAAAASAPVNQDQYVARMDHRFSEKNSFYGSYMFNTQATFTIPTFGVDTDNNRARTQNLSLSDTHVFSPSIVNELRVGWNRFFEHEFFGSTGNPSFDVANLIGLPGVSKAPVNYGYPTFSNAGFDFPITRGIGPRDRLNQVWQGGDNVSIRKGNHFITVGALILRRNWTFNESVNPRGSFVFDGRTTSGGASPVRENSFAAFLLGLATDAQVSVEPFATRMNNWNQAYYAQDDWKVTPHLTVNVGLRYDYFAPPVQRGKASNFLLNGAVPGFVPSQQIFHGFPDHPDSPGPASLVNPRRTDFGPRIGFAYAAPQIPDFVVRGGYGIYYTPEITNSWTGLTTSPPAVNTFDFSGTFDKPVQVATAFAGTGTALPTFAYNVVDPNLRDTYVQQWNLTVQKKLPWNTYVDVGYVGSKGTNLTMAFDGNRPLQVVVPGPNVASITARRPLQGYGAMTVTKSIGNSTYHSLQVKVERRVAKGLSVLGAYTFSKSLADADISTVGGGSFLGPIQDYLNLSREKSPTAFDLRHRLSIAAIYDLPIFNHASYAAVRTLLGGWQLGAIITEQTGFGAALATVGDTTGTGVASRPTVAPGQSEHLSNRGRNEWFNTAAFIQTPLGTFGNAARNEIHLPGLNQVDLSMTKNFRIRERNNIMFRTEFFNALNHINLGAPGLSLQAPNTFGVITTSVQGAAGIPNDKRIIQFGLKYQF